MGEETLKERLKRVDPDRYRASLLADGTVRGRLHVLYGFHYELAKVPELVSEPLMGDIRYQWWRDAVDEIYSGKPVRKHEIATPLAEVITECNLPRFWVDKLIDGRARDLDPQPFANLDVARDYADATSGLLLKLAAKVCGADMDEARLTAMGRAWGLTGLARAYPFYHDRILSDLAFQDLCEAAWETYREAKGKVPAALTPATAYVGLVPKYLSRLSRLSDPKTDTVSFSPILKTARLYGVALTGRV